MVRCHKRYSETDEPKVISESSSDIDTENIPKTKVIPSISASESNTALKSSLAQLKEQLKISFDKKRLERRKRPEES